MTKEELLKLPRIDQLKYLIEKEEKAGFVAEALSLKKELERIKRKSKERYRRLS